VVINAAVTQVYASVNPPLAANDVPASSTSQLNSREANRKYRSEDERGEEGRRGKGSIDICYDSLRLLPAGNAPVPAVCSCCCCRGVCFHDLLFNRFFIWKRKGMNLKSLLDLIEIVQVHLSLVDQGVDTWASVCLGRPFSRLGPLFSLALFLVRSAFGAQGPAARLMSFPMQFLAPSVTIPDGLAPGAP